PNLPEAAALLDEAAAGDEEAMVRQGRALLALGARGVLVKGGHGTGEESVDLLVTGEGVRRFAAPRIATRNTHGTGCALSSAIAAGLAQGAGREAAVGRAKSYLNGAIGAGDALTIGAGHGP